LSSDLRATVVGIKAAEGGSDHETTACDFSNFIAARSNTTYRISGTTYCPVR
jgi:hypothetical protein